MDFSKPYSNIEGKETQFSEEQSVSTLMHQSVVYLGKEITKLRDGLMSKNEQFAELKVNCARQIKNITDQTMDLEHLKLKIEHEEINRESRFEKINDSRENCKKMEMYFTTWVKGINQMMMLVEELKNLTKEIKINLENDKINIIFNKQDSEQSLNQAKEAIMALDVLGERERREFNELQNHFNCEIKTEKEQILETQIQLQGLEVESLKKNTMFRMLHSTNIDLKDSYEALEKEKSLELEMSKATVLKLESILKAELIKGEQLNCRILELDSLSKEVDICIGDLEVVIHNLNAKQKQIIVKEEQHQEISDTLVNDVYQLSMETDSLKTQLSKNMNVDENNKDLKQKLDYLLEININLNDDLNSLTKNEQISDDELQHLNKQIDNMLNETDLTISKQVSVKQLIDELGNKQNDDVMEHNKISLGIDEYSCTLAEEHKKLNSKIITLNKSLADASNITIFLDNILLNLEKEYNKVHAILVDSELKLHIQVDTCGMVTNNVLDNILCLDVMILKSKEAYQQAQYNTSLNLTLKQDIDYIQKQLLEHINIYKQLIEELKKTHAYKLESKTKEMEDSRKKHERLFRNKEQKKTDAMVELKENRIKIADLKCQENNLNSELIRMEKKLVKCKNLISSLEKKLKVVAHVATEVSQSVTDTPSQGTNLLDVSNTSRFYSNKMKILNSPGSESSGLTINPDEMDKNTKLKLNNYYLSKNNKNPTYLKDGSSVKPQKNVISIDDWGFGC